MDQTLTKIVFELKIDADGYPPVAFESMWGSKRIAVRT